MKQGRSDQQEQESHHIAKGAERAGLPKQQEGKLEANPTTRQPDQQQQQQQQDDLINGSAAFDRVEEGAAGWGFNLSIAPLHVERRHWQLQQESRLLALDRTAELCTALLWLAALLRMPREQRSHGHLALALALGQLLLLHLAPRLWAAYRPLLLTVVQVARMSILLPLPYPAGAAVDGSSSSGSIWSTILSRMWSHMFLVLFHQMPITYHLPWLLFSTALGLLQALQHLPLAVPQPLEAGDPLLAVGSALEKALTLFTSSFCPGQQHHSSGSSGDRVLVLGMAPESSALASVLFMHVFGALLVPLYVAYLMEWRSKLRFLLSVNETPYSRLAVYSPAAAVTEGSSLLAGLLYTFWLLLIGLSVWAACSACATIYYEGA